MAILDLRDGVSGATLRTADFTAFNGQEGRRIGAAHGGSASLPNVSFAKDAEPEFIAVSHDSRTAYVTLQENNAIAVVDIKRAKVTDILPLGLKDHSNGAGAGAGLDASRRDDGPDRRRRTVSTSRPGRFAGAYQPDGIAAFKWHGDDFLVTANEGDPRNGDIDVETSRGPRHWQGSPPNQLYPIPLVPRRFPTAT